jgi:hypothetical protein
VPPLGQCRSHREIGDEEIGLHAEFISQPRGQVFETVAPPRHQNKIVPIAREPFSE